MNWSKEWPKSLTGKEIAAAQKADNIPLAWPTYNPEWPKAVTETARQILDKLPTPNPTTDPDGFVESLWPIVIGVDKGSNDQTALVVGGVIEGILHVNEMLTGNDANMRLAALTGTGIILTTIKDGSIVQKMVDPSEYNNKVPTHDPYTNPNAHIYHECACGAILDPGTKSFAALNNAASDAGWKIRWGHEHYIAHCVKCGEGVE